MTNPQTEIPSTTFYKEMSKIVVNISDNHDATGTPTRVLMAIDAIHKLHQFELKKELTKAADTARVDIVYLNIAISAIRHWRTFVLDIRGNRPSGFDSDVKEALEYFEDLKALQQDTKE